MSRPKVTLDLTVPGFKKLADYLETHESDIADEINDFADLREIYMVVFDDNPVSSEIDGRKPEA